SSSDRRRRRDEAADGPLFLCLNHKRHGKHKRHKTVKMETTFNRKHLLGIRELEAQEITHLLDTAETFRDVSKREIKKVPALRGRTVINLFFEPSTRTRTSF